MAQNSVSTPLAGTGGECLRAAQPRAPAEQPRQAGRPRMWKGSGPRTRRGLPMSRTLGWAPPLAKHGRPLLGTLSDRHPADGRAA